MNPTPVETKNLCFILCTTEQCRADIERLSPSDRAQVSPVWLARLEAAPSPDPWVHGFTVVHRESGVPVGKCGFKGPPSERVVEIAYGIASEHQGKGYATEAAQAVTAFALASGLVDVVRAHTLPESNASGRVLAKCGFRHLGEVIDPEDGLVWRWEAHA